MKAITDLRLLFVFTAILEAIYCAASLLTPPHLVEPLFGWDMSADGHWALKLLGLALGVQALTAWVLRREPPVAVAWCLAIYQVGATGVDITLWAMLADDGIFAAPVAQAMMLTAIPTHFVLGVLLAIGALRQREAPVHA